MRPIAAIGSLLLAGCCAGANFDPRVLRLIGDDTRLVTCTDLDRQEASALFQILAGHGHAASRKESSVRALWIRDADGQSPSFNVFLGEETAGFVDPSGTFAPLDSRVMLAGNADSVREGQRRWNLDRPPSPLAVKARRLAESYDSWFLVVKPFALGPTAPGLAHLQDLIEAVEEVSGGIRFGAVNEIAVEAILRRTEDAAAIATLARWLPGLMQMKAPELFPGVLVEAMENFTVHASGQRAFLSVRFPEDKLRAVIEKSRSRVIE